MPDAGTLFRLEPIKSPWGDYGSLLEHGMSMHLDRMDDVIQLERVGPYIAPITFPGAGDIVVTGSFRTSIEQTSLTGFTFKPVIKAHIVELEWQSWNFSARKPQEYPEGGEPENYILGKPHSSSASDAIGDLWELVLHAGIDVEREGWKVKSLLEETWDDTDFFTGRTTRINCVSLKARQWLEQNFGDYVSFGSIVS